MGRLRNAKIHVERAVKVGGDGGGGGGYTYWFLISLKNKSINVKERLNTRTHARASVSVPHLRPQPLFRPRVSAELSLPRDTVFSSLSPDSH